MFYLKFLHGVKLCTSQQRKFPSRKLIDIPVPFRSDRYFNFIAASDTVGKSFTHQSTFCFSSSFSDVNICFLEKLSLMIVIQMM